MSEGMRRNENVGATDYELRETVREAHEAIRDLRQARRDAEQVGRELADQIRRSVGAAFRKEVLTSIEGWRAGFDDAVREAKRETLREFSQLAKVALEDLINESHQLIQRRADMPPSKRLFGP